MKGPQLRVVLVAQIQASVNPAMKVQHVKTRAMTWLKTKVILAVWLILFAITTCKFLQTVCLY